jgi:translation initiation factor 2B subunit (eIF-2B alpha/beta/delta family)
VSNANQFEWLNSDYTEDYGKLKKFVEETWKECGDSEIFTPHGADHCFRVEKMIKLLIPPEKWNSISNRERKILTWCAWTHDVGMFKSLYPPDTGEDEIRSKHVDTSSEWVLKNKEKLGISPIEAQVIAYIIRFHARKYRFNECDERRQCDGQWVRTRLIGAYLRIADALDVSHTRVDEHQNVRFQLLQRLISGDRDVTLFHWIKSFLVTGIIPNHSKQVFEVEFQIPKGYDFNKYAPLLQYVVNELKQELETVESILDEGGLSSFHNVVESKTEFIQLPGYDLWIKSLPDALIYLQIASSPSSSSMTEATLDSLELAIEREYSDKALFREKLIQFRESLNDKLEKRPGHTQLRYICKAIDIALNHLSVEIESAIKILKDFIKGFKKLFGPDGSKRQAENLKEALNKLCREENRTSWNFLLYGSSRTVASALAELDINIPIILLIAEGRPKTIHGAYNTPTYLDAESYANLIRSEEPEKRKAKVFIIPDACIATAMKLGMLKKLESSDDKIKSDAFFPKIDAVLFGGNGIFIHPSISSSNTAGAYGITLAAKYLNVPVIAVSNATKIWDEYDQNWQFRHRAKENKWLTSLSKLRDRLCEENQLSAEINWNPREDYIPFEDFSAIVTNYGIIYSKSKNPKATLCKWREKVFKDCNIENLL